MELSPGTRVGSCEIVGLIGAGGMGEVYRARDTVLGREVAVKRLPDALAADADRTARFEREARLLASLNHPNIALIHDLRVVDGATYLVLELVEGPTLADRIAAGALPLDEAVDVARQIAEALAAAHDRGIVHRDLKPANIKVRADGTVKVLDFGLAKATSDEGAPPNLTQSPTLSIGGTQAGVILGTAAYMSPEQAKGQPVDRRTDLFAFGAVLYEMLTGCAAFGGETVGDVLAAVIRAEPDWGRLPPATPAPIRRLLRRCLEKSRSRRLDSATTARLELEDVGQEPAHAVAQEKQRRPSVRVALQLGHVVLTTVLAGALFWLGSGAAPTLRSAVRFDVLLPDGLRFTGPPGAADTANSGTVSPDGTRLVYVAADADERSRLWIRDLSDTTARVLPGTENASMPFWSPDGRAIAYFADGKLRRIDAAGGPVRTVSDAASATNGGSWGASGVILFHGEAGLLRVPAEGGTPARATTIDESRGETRHRWPYFLPDGRHFLFRSSSGGTLEERSEVMVGVLDSSEVKPLLTADAAAVFAPPDLLLFAREQTLLAQRFDPNRLALVGEPVPVADAIPSQTGMPAYSVSETGVLTYRTIRRQSTQLAWLDRDGRLRSAVGPVGDFQDLALSPDETHVAVTNRQDGEIWILRLADGQYRRLTFEGGNHAVAWSPDGTRVAYSSSSRADSPGQRLFVRAATGAQPERLVHRLPLAGGALAQWFPDGERLLFFGSSLKTGLDIGSVAVDHSTVTWVLQSDYSEVRPSLSPDGRWLAYIGNARAASYEVFVQPFPPDGSMWQVSSAGGQQVAWRRDGRELYYLTADRRLFAVEVSTGPGFRFGAPRFLFETPVNTTGNIRNSFVPAADGQRFLVNRLIADEPPKITVVLNWNQELKQRVPTR